MAPEPELEREGMGHVEVREKGRARGWSLSRLRRKTNPKDINAEDFLPSGVTPQKALQMPRNMIQNAQADGS